MTIDGWELEFTPDVEQLATVSNTKPHFNGAADHEWRLMVDSINEDLVARRVVRDPNVWAQRAVLPALELGNESQTSYLAEAWTAAAGPDAHDVKHAAWVQRRERILRAVPALNPNA